MIAWTVFPSQSDAGADSVIFNKKLFVTIKAPDPPPALPLIDRQTQKLRSRLEKERLSLARWMKRLKRAFTAVMKL